jgi:hypothetical protein
VLLICSKVNRDFIFTRKHLTSIVDFKSPFDAHIVSALKAAGAQVIGKTNMDEFGMG